MDIDFSLDKVDQNGELITSDETEFKVWYIDKVKDENGEERSVQMYCQMEEDGTYVWVEDSSAVVRTSGGKLEIDYTLMKDIVYYLQESKAPEGYSADTTVYVITDQETGVKYPLADYELLPNMAIVDVDNMMSQPKGLTSASGVDVLTHALEAYASIMATDYTDGLALKAMKSVFEYLPRAYNDGTDLEARQKMADASCMAGMAFANAFLGVCHSMAHKLGAFHHLPHGIANALMISLVVEFNSAEVPPKMGTFSQYQYPHTMARYAECARFCGISAKSDEDAVKKLIEKIEELKKAVGVKATIKDYGVDEKYFLDTLDAMVEQAFDDQCTGANPRYPLMSEIKEMYLKAYYGK